MGSAAISADGRFVAFESHASNLVPGDTNDWRDVFVYDRQSRTMERVSIASDGAQGNGDSQSPSLNADGRFIAFLGASNLVPGDTNGRPDVFVYDRQSRTIERVSIASDGTQGNENSEYSSLIADGRFVAFSSLASNLVSGHANGLFVRMNNRAPRAFSRSIGLHAGQVVAGVDFGLVPDPGAIRGQCFDDLIANGLRDHSEPGRAGCVVFLDANGNGRRDASEVNVASDADGRYVFSNLDAELEYRVAIEVPDGQELVLPSMENGGVWRVYLPAGGTVTDRDFGLRPVATLGQFQNATVQGRLFVDHNGNGRQDPGEPGMGGVRVFLDLNDDGILQYNEPRMFTLHDEPGTQDGDESGWYSFPNLGYRTYTVRALVDSHQRQTGPLGNQFARVSRLLSAPGVAFGNPHDAAIADFTGDGIPDLAIALFDRSAISILPGDGQGGFLAAIDVPLAPAGIGPTALLSGDFVKHGGDDGLLA